MYPDRDTLSNVPRSGYGEGKRRNEFAEWHVAWLAEWHNYAECKIWKMAQRNKLNWKTCARLCRAFFIFVAFDNTFSLVAHHYNKVKCQNARGKTTLVELKVGLATILGIIKRIRSYLRLNAAVIYPEIEWSELLSVSFRPFRVCSHLPCLCECVRLIVKKC